MFSLVLPAFNEQKSLVNDDYLENLLNYLNKKYSEYEVIIVNDGSTDSTKELLLSKQEKYKNIKIINHVVNMGYGSSLKTGIANAKNDTIIISDIDGTYPFEEIPNLLDIYLNSMKDSNVKIDMVVGERTGKNYWEGFVKTFLRFVLRFLVEFSSGKKINDINSGLRVFSKKTISNYFKVLSNYFSFSTSSTLVYLLNNKSVSYHKIDYLKRKGDDNKSKVNILRDSLRTIQYVVESLVLFNPLKLFLIISLIFLFISLISLICSFYFEVKVLLILSIIFFCFSLLSLLFSFFSVLFKKSY